MFRLCLRAYIPHPPACQGRRLVLQHQGVWMDCQVTLSLRRSRRRVRRRAAPRSMMMIMVMVSRRGSCAPVEGRLGWPTPASGLAAFPRRATVLSMQKPPGLRLPACAGPGPLSVPASHDAHFTLPGHTRPACHAVGIGARLARLDAQGRLCGWIVWFVVGGVRQAWALSSPAAAWPVA